MANINFNSWSLAESLPGQFNSPAELEQHNPDWLPATVPGTVAESLKQAGVWDIDQVKDFDASDWWYSSQFNFNNINQHPVEINFEGLATLCEIWLNGQQIYYSTNMFLPVSLNIRPYLNITNHLYLCFRALNSEVTQRKPRPAWKTRLVSHQNLRWFRTTLLGKIPGWSPPISPVGPWLPATITNGASIHNLQTKVSIQNNDGIVDISFKLHHEQAQTPSAAFLFEDQSRQLEVSTGLDGSMIRGQLKIENIKPWYPHTHGEPNLYPASIEIKIGNEILIHHLPPIGFKITSVETENGQFKLTVNGQAIFCRGACWTINDIISLCGKPDNLKSVLYLMQQAGANMIRIGGTMIYEQDLFYSLCDELGMLVWQDFMFANMDYPVDEESYKNLVTSEITHQLSRLSRHACITVYCGNSEVEQQATMLGLSPDAAKNDLFYQLIPTLCEKLHSGIPYTPSTPVGDPLPFHTDKGLSHYYGIGAYQRPLHELRNHHVRFTPETLGFANVPTTETRNQLFKGEIPVIHDPRWKMRTPRDSGTGWDFEDIRDFYLHQLYGKDPTQLRYSNPTLYLRLSEITTGEVMQQVYNEWRSLNSECTGGLIWFMKDLWPGAGWGIIDSQGIPKACYYYLKRAWQPVNLLITNETLNGIEIHIINESPKDISGNLNIQVLNKGHVVTAQNSKEISVDRNSQMKLNSDEILDHFYDLTYSYRFGMPKHNVVSVSLTKDEKLISHAYFFPEHGIPQAIEASSIIVKAIEIGENKIEIRIESDRLLYNAMIEAKGYTSDDNFFHVIPGIVKRITLTKALHENTRFTCYLNALNLDEEIKVNLD